MKYVRRDPDQGYLDSVLWLPKTKVSAEILRSALTIRSYSMSGESDVHLYQETRDHILVPRAYMRPDTLPFPVTDCRPREYERTNITGEIKLDHRFIGGRLVPTGDTMQQEALQALLRCDGGILQLRCGGGKTITFFALMLAMQVPTLVIIDNVQLLQQWLGEAKKLLNVPGGIGLVQGQVLDDEWQKQLVFTTYSTLANRAATLPPHIRRRFGLICWDEGHHVGAATYQEGASSFPGKRILLTATPSRKDGLHLVYEMHIGGVVYKNLKQELRASFEVVATGMSLSPDQDKEAKSASGDYHLQKLGGVYATWTDHLRLILTDLRKFEQEGRKVLVLSTSVDEIVNLYTLWSLRWDEVGGPLPAQYLMTTKVLDAVPNLKELEVLDPKLRKAYEDESVELKKLLEVQGVQAKDVERATRRLAAIEAAIATHEEHKALETIAEGVRRNFIREVVKTGSAGLMTRKVSLEYRSTLTRDRNIIFAIQRYGKEGLDWPALDTVMITVPFSDRNILQQVMGRATRTGHAKLPPLVRAYQHDITQVREMCRSLLRHARDWPEDQGGPVECRIITL